MNPIHFGMILGGLLFVAWIFVWRDGLGMWGWRRWLRRPRMDDMRSTHMRFQMAVQAEDWVLAARIADADTEDHIWPGLKVIARQRRDEAMGSGAPPTAV